MLRFSLFVGCFVALSMAHGDHSGGKKINVYTVATESNDGLKRLQRSGKLFGFDVKVLGLGEKWKGGNMAAGKGGAQKINILGEELKKLCSPEAAEKQDELFMFVDAYDSVIVAPSSDIAEAFEKLSGNIVISAEVFLWPDRSLASEYPPVGPNEYPFLCSGGFIGYTKSICEMILPRLPVKDDDDDQLFYTKIYLDASLRESLNIKLDSGAEIFQNLHGALGDVNVKYMGGHSYAYNSKTGSQPKVLHGNGPIKVEFNRLTDYIPDGFSPNGGCLHCEEDTISLAKIKVEEWPIVVVAVFIELPTPFLGFALRNIHKLSYPKNRISLFIHNNVAYHENNVTEFLSSIKTEEYLEFTLLGPEKQVREADARNSAIDACERIKCQYVFMVDSLARITYADTLNLLIEQNRPIIAPFLKRPDEMWSNFWGALTSNGFYKRSDDYLEIVKGNKKGLWNVPFISNAFLISAERLTLLRDAWTSADSDPDLAFCSFLREHGHFMHVTNNYYFGHLVNPDHYNLTRLHPELWEIETNRLDWEEMYLHPDRWTVGKAYENGTVEHQSKYEVCPDVYTFPLVTAKFCDDLVEIMEHFGEWSGGKHEDKRLSGGYENVPTVDIHMRQVYFDDQWLILLKKYISPLAQFAYTGYHPDSKSHMNFVVRYHPREQDHLRPHFDSSTFSTNIALRRIGIDFEGGGTRFVRYNCSFLGQQQGWVLMHPGRLTHWHEGLRVTKGVRYIAVSFVDP